VCKSINKKDGGLFTPNLSGGFVQFQPEAMHNCAGHHAHFKPEYSENLEEIEIIKHVTRGEAWYVLEIFDW